MPMEITATLTEWYSVYSSYDLMLASLSTSPGACSICSNMVEVYTRSVPTCSRVRARRARIIDSTSRSTSIDP